MVNMESKQFKKEDYIYLKIANDFELGDREWDMTKYHQGQILRFRKKWLIDAIKSRQFGYVFNQYGFDGLDYVKNPECNENDILLDKLYSSITLNKDRSYNMCLWPKDLLYINEWFKSHIDPRSLKAILSSSKKVITDGETSSNVIEIGDRNVEARINFRAGEVLDFTDPGVRLLFYDRDWLKILVNSELVIGEEKEQLFNEDFSNAIYAQDEISSSVYRDDPTHDLNEFHYFVLNDDVKIKDRYAESVNINGEDIKLPWIAGLDYDKDENGYLRVAHVRTWSGDSSPRWIEQELLKIGRRATREEAKDLHKKRIAEYLKRSDERDEEMRKEWAEQARLLKEAYESNKNNPEYFPGVNGEFVHTVDDKVQQIQQQKYSLEQIKAFYQNLSKINSNILQGMCFYGGTIPYMLTDAQESREFGDIDIFVPIQIMENLRSELQNQDSFRMIYDSKPLAASCHLTSRIQKESKALKNKDDETRETLEFMGLLSGIMNSDDDTIYLNEDGKPSDPFESFFSSRRDWYNKTQDFGFKANLFGVNISIFPLYQYGNDIMAKSFNVNELYKFLLGVRVMNNTKISDFVRNVQIYDSAVKILPLEFTLVSKRSAIDENYKNRMPKDVADIEYILQHKDELGISDEMIEQIKANYPDYSVSIAYKINESGETDTMGGERYKEYILMNKGARSLS